MAAPYGAISICGLRVAKLTAGGAPDDGASNGYQTNDIIRAQIGFQTETGTSVVQKDGCGNIRFSLTDPDTVTGVNLTLDLCSLDAKLKALMLGGTYITSSGNPFGYEAPALDATAPTLCTEFWVKAYEGSAQVTDTTTSPDPTYYHFVFPSTKWTQADNTYENGTFAVDQITGFGVENASITQNGPFDDWPTPIVANGGITNVYGWWYDNDVPTTTAYVNETSAAS